MAARSDASRKGLLSLEGQGRAGALADQLPLHLRQALEERQHKTTVRCGGIEGFRDTVQLDVTRQEGIID